jgi:hypothetical protein
MPHFLPDLFAKVVSFSAVGFLALVEEAVQNVRAGACKVLDAAS